MVQKRDTRSAITSAVIGAILATLILFALYYFAGNRSAPAVPPAAETSR